MKNYLLLLFAICIILPTQKASAQDEDETSCFSFYSPDSIFHLVDIPIDRQTYGGTKIIADLPSEWSEAQQNAFLYACELWEEVLPTLFPIRIKVVSVSKNEYLTTGSVLSKVKAASVEGAPHSGRAYTTQAKAVLYTELAGIYDSYFFYENAGPHLFSLNDIVITYYEFGDMKYDDIYSFSSDASHVGNKYDFITCALRDIGKGLGFASDWHIKNGVLKMKYKNTTHFDMVIASAMSPLAPSNQDERVYVPPTSGQLTIANGYNLYAPSPWNNQLSLNYFIPNSNLLTQLLRWDFGKGSVIRSISSSEVNKAFKNLLGWVGDIAVGLGGGTSTNESGQSTANAIPYGGTLAFDMSNSLNSEETLYKANARKRDVVASVMEEEDDSLSTSFRYMEQFLPMYHNDGTVDNEGHSVALMKKDGTWDVVYYDDNTYSVNIPVSRDDLNLHYPDSIYARTFDGNYRCRMSFRMQTGPRSYYLKVYHCYLKAIPQKIKTNISRCQFLPEYDDPEDEYLGVIKVGINNIEGVTRVEVAQYEYGESIPFYYEVPNFKDGYFLATVDKEFDTRFEIIAYNESGYSVSDTYTFHPGSSFSPLSFKRRNNEIEITTIYKRQNYQALIKAASVMPIFPNSTSTNNISTTGNKIDIGNLKKGDLYTECYRFQQRKLQLQICEIVFLQIGDLFN